MTEYSVIRAPSFYGDVDAMQTWFKCQSAIGQELVCAYSDRHGRAVFVFRLSDISVSTKPEEIIA